jgi:hypothetical protein
MLMFKMDSHDSADSFDRVATLDGELLGSACIFCRRFIAFCDNPEQLYEAERAHVCPQMKKSA